MYMCMYVYGTCVLTLRVHQCLLRLSVSMFELLTNKNMLLSFLFVDTDKPEVTLCQILSFFTGCEAPPPTGFDCVPSLLFDDSAVFPTASTCALQLVLPTMYYRSPEKFHEIMIYAMLNHGGFGNL